MIEVELSKIIIDEKRQDQIIVLKEKGGTRQIPIVIGFMEASSIQMTVSGVGISRPLTHDLLMSVIDILDAYMERLLIDDLVANTFHAKLELRTKEGDALLVDARPSDGIAMAVRARAPIFVEEDIFDKASLMDK